MYPGRSPDVALGRYHAPAMKKLTPRLTARQRSAVRREARGDRDLQRAMRLVLEDGDTERLQEWFDDVARRDPLRACELFVQLAAYAKPPS